MAVESMQGLNRFRIRSKVVCTAVLILAASASCERTTAMQNSTVAKSGMGSTKPTVPPPRFRVYRSKLAPGGSIAGTPPLAPDTFSTA